MKKTTIQKYLSLLILLFISLVSSGQHLMYEISLAEQIENSSQVVEGKVVAKKSYWNAEHTKIYTVNTIQVYKVFKGQSLSTIDVVTQGGNVGARFHVVNPSLNLRIGNVGVFTLEPNSIKFEDGKNSDLISFQAYSSKQGFYKYDVYEDRVVNPFSKRDGVSTSFYNELKSLTDRSFTELKKYDFNSELISNKTVSSKLDANITGISPISITAGTESQLTITGTGFGASQGAGKIFFANADSGGVVDVEPFDSQIVSWSDIEIVVEVPSNAGTGVVRVDPDGGASMDSQVITIPYALLNAETASAPFFAFRTQHTNMNFMGGGMTWKMNTDFDADLINSGAKASFMRAFNNWICATEVNWVIGNTSTEDSAENDNVNIITFSSTAVGTLGVCTSYFLNCTNGVYVEELDIVFDDSETWNFDSGAPSGGEYDFETVAVHELGHGHQLGHVIDPGVAIMHYSVAPGVSNRVLSANDIAGGADVHSRSTTIDLDCRTDGVMTNLACPTASIEDQLLASGISIFPNPTNNRLTIQNNTYLNLKTSTIYDVSGRLLFQKEVEGFGRSSSIDVSNLSDGIYFINIVAEEGFTTKRFVKN